jgi:hypothetical protein
MSEKMQTELLSRLYDLNIPAVDIALVVNAMRGKSTKDEEAELLLRLYSLQVPSAFIAQLVDAMRNSDGARSEGVVRHNEPTDDGPPSYDFKAQTIG